MTSLLRRVAITLALGVLLFIPARYVSLRNGEKRLAAGKDRVNTACRTYRAQPGHEDALVCRSDAYGPMSYDMRNHARAAVREAKDAFARGEPRIAHQHLTTAVADVRRMDRRGTTGGLMAGDMLAEILDVVDAHRHEVDARSLLAGVELQVAEHPFESWRIHHMWTVSSARDDQFLATTISAAEVADELEREQESYSEMQAATLAGDTARCLRAARGLGALASGTELNAGLCTRMEKVVRIGKRLHAVRSS